MHKRDLFFIVIIIGFLLNLVSLLSINIIINSIQISVTTANISNSLEVLKIFLQFAFTIPFFVIILVYFRKDKNLTYFTILVLVSRVFMNINVAMITMSIENGLNNALVVFSSFAAIGSIILAFRMMILDEYDKKFPQAMLFISAVYLIIESGIAIFTIYMFSAYFGNLLFFMIVFMLHIAVMFAELMVIKILFKHKFNRKEKPKTEIVYAMDAVKKMREERALKQKEEQ